MNGGGLPGVLVGTFSFTVLVIWSDYASGVFIAQINPDDYPSSATLQLEAVLKTSNASFASFARLFNITDGTQVAGSQIQSTSTTGERKRGSAITLVASDKEYKIQRGGLPGATYRCHTARVVVQIS